MKEHLRFRIDNLADPVKRLAWVDLLRDIFGVDFAAFSKLNIWPEGYRGFSYLDGDVVAANISFNPLPLRMEGRDVLAGQLQGVATRLAYRRCGLFHDLMDKVLTFAAGYYAFLLLYTETPALYEPFGFRLLQEHSFTGRLQAAGFDPAARDACILSMQQPEDVALLRRLYRARRPVSEQLGLLDNEGVFFSNLLRDPSMRLSYLPGIEAVLVWDRKGTAGRVRLLDIVAADMPPPTVLATALDLPAPDAEIDVLFPPDQLTGTFSAMPYRHADGDLLMVRGPVDLGRKPFMLPLTALS